eukprot:934863-Pleurochrysis_carterae.AAC.1
MDREPRMAAKAGIDSNGRLWTAVTPGSSRRWARRFAPAATSFDSFNRAKSEGRVSIGSLARAVSRAASACAALALKS